MSKILITDLAKHQQEAVLNGESAIYNGGDGAKVVTRADVETKDERQKREEAEKVEAEAAAKVVEDGVAAQLATGELVSKTELEDLRRELASVKSDLAKVTASQNAAPTQQGQNAAPAVNEARKAELDAMNLNDVRKLAKDKGVTQDGNTKDEVVAAILAHEAAQGSA